jgi:acyl dehydratase
MHPLTARLFGFPKAIAHGMWTAARVLSALEGRLPEAFVYEARFRAPVLLPTKVAFRASEAAGGWDATLTDARSERLHLAGSVRPL